jgi:hypothetical protein
MSAALGLVKDSFSPACKFHGVFLQIAHKGQNPISEQPAFRLLRFVNNKVDVAPASALLAQHLPGNILFQAHNQSTLICTNLDRQTSAEYVLAKTAAIKEAYLAYIAFLDQDFAENRRARREGDQEAARTRHQEYTQQYNEKGWVKFMRAQQKIHPDVQIIPGMHAEAEAQSQRLAPAEPEPAPESTTADDAAYPDAARKKGQRYAAVSMLLDDSEDMEVLVFVHAVYSDMAVAKEHVEHELSEMMHPLPIDVVDLYEWIYPVQMRWEDNHLSQRVTELDETWNNQELGSTQLERFEAVKKNRKLKHDILKKKEMDASVQAQIAEHLGVETDDLLRILDNPAYGAEAVIKWAQMDDVAERQALARAALKA